MATTGDRQHQQPSPARPTRPDDRHAGTVFNGSCTNGAGLTTNATPLTVKLDKTGPSAALAVTAGTPGAHGWYTTDVTVSTNGADDISGPVTCTADQHQTAETTGQESTAPAPTAPA